MSDTNTDSALAITEQPDAPQMELGVPPDTPKITKEEVENFIVMATKLCSMAVHRMLIKHLPEVEHLLPKPTEPGHVSISFREFPERLNMCFILGKHPYQAEIDVPPGYEKEVCGQYMLLKTLAMTYWNHLITTETQLAEYLNRIDADKYKTLKVDSTYMLSMYFDEAAPYRLCILPYYVNAKGQPLTRNTR
jgi:hypothetical protein